MTVRTEIRTASAPAKPARTGLLAWLLAADARFRQSRRMARLTREQRDDMGLPKGNDPVDARTRANMRFLSGQW